MSRQQPTARPNAGAWLGLIILWSALALGFVAGCTFKAMVP